MIVRVANGRIGWEGGEAPCALGRAGIVAGAAKREGDGATPAGRYAFRRVLYRPDRMTGGDPPASGLPVAPIREDDGWCDAPDDPAYNRPVRLPYPASAEQMRRADGLYDLVVVIGHNDDPPAPGMGSAIFVHCARTGADGSYEATEGCVALEKEALRALIARLRPGDEIEIAPE